jgi:hypothetical protein
MTSMTLINPALDPANAHTVMTTATSKQTTPATSRIVGKYFFKDSIFSSSFPWEIGL